MRYVFLPLLFVFSVVFGQKHAYDNLTTVRDKSTRFTDSLISNNIDTIISYYTGSASCPALPPKSIIYWKHKGITSAVVFKTKTKHKREKLGEYHFNKLPEEYDMSYFDKNVDRISQDVFNDSAHRYIMNYTFEEMLVKMGGSNLKYSFRAFNRDVNTESYKVAFIDNFLSFMQKMHVL
jgi:hypothetical protein